MSSFSVSPYRVMVQKPAASGFHGQFFRDEKAAALQLLWEHLVRAPDQAAALAELRADLEQHLSDFYREWIEPAPRPSWLDGGAEALTMAKEDDARAAPPAEEGV